jgi:hypothetical protein
MQSRRALMRTLGLAVVLVTNLAHAEAPSVVVGIGEESVGKDTRGAFSVESAVEGAGVYDTGANHGWVANARGFGALRAGSDTDVVLGIEGGADVGYAFANEFVKLSGVYANASLGNRPGLASRRDVARDTFATAGTGFRLTPLFHERGDLRTTWLRFGFGGSLTHQGGSRATITGELGLYMRCRVRTDGVGRCIHVLDMQMVGNSGAQEVFVGNSDLIKVTGLGTKQLHAELGIRSISNQGSISVHEGEGEATPEETVTTEDLPAITELAPVVGLTAIAGPTTFALRAERTGYASLDGDMTIEDRASLTTSLSIRRHTFTLGGFAARTRWWSSKMDPGSSDSTGGGELGFATRWQRFDLKATVGLARSFYPVLDGGAADSPATGFRSSVQVSRAIDL